MITGSPVLFTSQVMQAIVTKPIKNKVSKLSIIDIICNFTQVRDGVTYICGKSDIITKISASLMKPGSASMSWCDESDTGFLGGVLGTVQILVKCTRCSFTDHT